MQALEFPIRWTAELMSAPVYQSIEQLGECCVRFSIRIGAL